MTASSSDPCTKVGAYANYSDTALVVLFSYENSCADNTEASPIPGNTPFDDSLNGYQNSSLVSLGMTQGGFIAMIVVLVIVVIAVGFGIGASLIIKLSTIPQWSLKPFHDVL